MMTCTKGHKKNRNFLRQAGFTLIELLLVIGVIGAVTIAVTEIFESMAVRVANQRIAKQMLDVQSAGEAYVAANFNELLTVDIPNANDIVEITLADLKADNYLDANFRETNRFGQNITIFVRNIGNAYTGGDTFEVLAISEDPGATPIYIKNGRLREIAQNGGAKLGYSSEIITPGEIISIAGQWQVDRAAFEAAGLNLTPSAADGGYLAGYGRISLAQALDDEVLYKVELASNPDANIMETNLDMNSYQLQNVAAVTVDRLEVEGNANILGRNLTGTTGGELLSNSLVINQQAEFAGGANIRHRVTGPIGAGCAFTGGRDDVVGAGCDIEGGSLNIDFQSNATDALQVIGTVDMIDVETASGVVGYEGTVIAETTDVNGVGSTAVTFTNAEFQDVVITGADEMNVGQMTSSRFNFANAAQTANIDNGPIQIGTNLGAPAVFPAINAAGMIAFQAEVASGNINFNDMLVTQSLRNQGNLDVTGTTNVTDRLTIVTLAECTEAGSGDDCKP